MKELSIEQKAEAYDEAIKRAKCVIEQNPLMEYLKKGIEYILPEFKENEDEKIRKAIHIYFDWLDGRKDYAPKGKYTIRDMIAWLEKQGEQKQDPCEHCADKRLNCHNFPCVKGRAFKQGKSVLEVIKEEKVDNANKAEPFDKYEGLTDFERTLADICFARISKEEPNWKQYIKDNADVLLKIAVKKFNSVQEQKPAWSEEDKIRITHLISLVEHHHNKDYDYFDYSDLAKWLKSLKQRYTWKPSDAQMIALNDVIANGHLSNANERIFKGLQEQLKKLRGE